jgi:hypothetical protein
MAEWVVLLVVGTAGLDVGTPIPVERMTVGKAFTESVDEAFEVVLVDGLL